MLDRPRRSSFNFLAWHIRPVCPLKIKGLNGNRGTSFLIDALFDKGIFRGNDVVEGDEVDELVWNAADKRQIRHTSTDMEVWPTSEVLHARKRLELFGNVTISYKVHPRRHCSLPWPLSTRAFVTQDSLASW